MSNLAFQYLSRPNSRFTKLPPRDVREGPLADLLENNVDILLYLKNINPADVGNIEKSLSYYTAQEEGLLSDIGVDWNFDPKNPGIGTVRRIQGNIDAVDLLNEYDEAIDQVKDGLSALSLSNPSNGEDAILQRYVKAFGETFLKNKSLVDATDLTIAWAKNRLKARMREQNNNIHKDLNIAVLPSQRARHTQIHMRSNEVVHQTSLAEDILWVQCPSVDTNEAVFSNTRDLSVAQFEAIYGIRVPEAEAIIHYACQYGPPDAQGHFHRTTTGDLFSWIYQLIEEFVEWKYLVTTVWLRMNWNHARDWEGYGGLKLDTVYLQFIDEVFKIVRVVQAGEQLTEGVLAPFKNMSNLLLAYVDLLQWNIVPLEAWNTANRSTKEFVSNLFPETIPDAYIKAKRIKLLPGVNFKVAPRITFPRQAVKVNPGFYTLSRSTQAVEFPNSYAGERVFPPSLGMDRKVNLARRYPKSRPPPPGILSARASRFFEDDSQPSDYDDDYEDLARVYDLDPAFDVGSYGHLDENVVDRPSSRRKHVSFAAEEPHQAKPPFRLASGDSLKRRRRRDVSGTRSNKRTRLAV
ncbi:hypothetical protein F4805DRAFT_106877 [Annulohypoxylon moriforme]|nr:hypothetical protein F4805DRAFT_106877 [Annulohypoxylon moriforme]